MWFGGHEIRGGCLEALHGVVWQAAGRPTYGVPVTVRLWALLKMDVHSFPLSLARLHPSFLMWRSTLTTPRRCEGYSAELIQVRKRLRRADNAVGEIGVRCCFAVDMQSRIKLCAPSCTD
jgi:hypothetical protein